MPALPQGTSMSLDGSFAEALSIREKHLDVMSLQGLFVSYMLRFCEGDFEQALEERVGVK